MSTATRLAPAAATASPWFRSARFDVLLILGVPFLTWPLIMLGLDTFGAERMNQWILITATGHYFATFVRTYGDKELFQRFQLRFLLAPILLLTGCLYLFLNGHGPELIAVTAGWGFWHWLAQAFGFARIYDIKVGSFDRWTSWLDKALVIAGFVGAVVLTDGATAEFAGTFLDAGVPLPSARVWNVVRWVIAGSMGVIGIAYVANLLNTIRQGKPWSWQKQFMHVTTIGYYWFAFAWLPNIVVAYVLYELFHDVQYYAITWLTCRGRVRREGVASWFSFMFRPSWLGVFVFMGTMLLLGGVDAFGRVQLASDDPAHQTWLAIFLSCALLHYYYDGFIWKARENTLSRDLGIQGGLRNAIVPSVRHLASWSVFLVPLGALLLVGGNYMTTRQKKEALVALAPGDFLNQAQLALELASAGEIDRALEHYAASVAANGDLAEVRSNYGAALEIAGDLDAARIQYDAALACRDQGDAHARAHLNLGVLLQVNGEPEKARPHLDAARSLGGEDPIARLMGLAKTPLIQDPERKEAFLGAILQLDPNHLESRFDLATRLFRRGAYEATLPHFRFLIDKRPDVLDGRIGLTSALTELGRHDEARTALREAMRLAPNDREVIRLKGRLGIE